MRRHLGKGVLVGTLTTFIAAELWFVHRSHPNSPPLTHLVVDNVPAAVGIPAAVGLGS